MKKKVRITVKETIQYDQEIEITEEQFNELKEWDGQCVCSNQSGYPLIDDVVDKNNVLDNTGEWIDFEMEEVK